MTKKSVILLITLLTLVFLASIPVYADTVVKVGSTYELHPDASENQYEIIGITGNFESDDLSVNLDLGDMGTFLEPEYMQGCYTAKAPVVVRSLDDGYVFGVYKLEYYTNDNLSYYGFSWYDSALSFSKGSPNADGTIPAGCEITITEPGNYLVYFRYDRYVDMGHTATFIRVEDTSPAPAPSPAPSPNPTPVFDGFNDLSESHWAYSNVNKMVEKNIIVGYPDGTFKPNNQVTYGEFIKMAVVGLTGEVLEVANAPNHWATNYYNKAVEMGLFTTNQIPINKLGSPIIRADMSLIAANAVEGDVSSSDAAIIEGYILDIHKATNRKNAVVKAYYLGILAGYPDQTFRPDQGLTRAESAAVIDRIINPASRIKIDLQAMKNATPPTFPDGRTVARKDLLTLMAKIDSERIDTAHDTFLKYKNGGYYNTEESDGKILGFVYHTGYRIDGTLAAIDKQNARVKFLLQHFLEDDWEKCYNDFQNMIKNYDNKSKEVKILVKYYNGYEVVMEMYNYSADLAIFRM